MTHEDDKVSQAIARKVNANKIVDSGSEQAAHGLKLSAEVSYLSLYM